MRVIILTLALIFLNANLLPAQEYNLGELHPEGGMVGSTKRRAVQTLIVLSQGGYVRGAQKYGFKNARCQLNADGNFIVYTDKNDIKWSSILAKSGVAVPLNWCWKMMER